MYFVFRLLQQLKAVVYGYVGAYECERERERERVCVCVFPASVVVVVSSCVRVCGCVSTRVCMCARV